MANVKVRSVGLIRQLLGQAELGVAVPEGTTVSGLLALLAEKKGERFASYAGEPTGAGAYASLRILVNGRDVVPAQTGQTVLQEGDDVLIFLPIAGG